MAPEYEKAAKELSQRTPPIPLAKVDATVESEVASRFDVSGYPTLKIFRKGKVFDYNGPREKYGRSRFHDDVLSGDSARFVPFWPLAYTRSPTYRTT